MMREKKTNDNSYSSNTQYTNTYSKSTRQALEKRCKIWSNLTIETPEQRQLRRPGSLLVTLNIFPTLYCFCCLF